MAPPVEYIKELFQKNAAVTVVQGQSGSILNFGSLKSILAPNVHLEVPGLGIEIDGVDQLDSNIVHPKIPALVDVLDTAKPIEVSPPQIYTGSDNSIVAIVSNKATTLSGKEFKNVTVAVLHFNSSDQVDSVTAYVDTKHLSEVFGEALSK